MVFRELIRFRGRLRRPGCRRRIEKDHSGVASPEGDIGAVLVGRGETDEAVAGLVDVGPRGKGDRREKDHRRANQE